MKTYARLSEKNSRTLDSRPKASNQASLNTILQRYGEGRILVSDQNRSSSFQKSEVIQRELSREFDKNCFNVAGETHYEAVKGAECALLRLYGLSPDVYYEEHELATDGGKIGARKNLVTLERPGADPLLLRTLQIVSFIEEAALKIEANIEIIRNLGIARRKAAGKGDKWRLFEIGQKLEERLIAIGGEALRVEEYVMRGFPCNLMLCKKAFESGEEREIDRGEVGIINELIEWCKTNYTFRKDAADISVLRGNAADILRKSRYIERELFGLGQIDLSRFEPAEDSLSSRVTASRSFYMHEAANRLNDTGAKGLWKIGNSHVHDIIRNAEPREIRYNLIEESDFKKILLKHKLGPLPPPSI